MAKLFKKKKGFNRALAFAITMAVLVAVSVSTTIAFLVTDTDSIKNIFVPSEVETGLKWTYIEDSGERTLKVENEGDIPIYVRAAVVVNWVKTDGEGVRHIHANAPKVGEDYTIHFNASSWIEKVYDGDEVIYYYKNAVYPKIMSENNYTNNLFSQYKVLGTEPPEAGYELEIEVVASGIQSTPVSEVEKAWGVDIDDAGNITAVN